MEKARIVFERLVKQEEGQTLAEVGLILGIVSIAAMATVNALGLEIKSFWDETANAIQSAF